MIDKAKPATPSPGDALGMSPLRPDDGDLALSSPALPDRYKLLTVVGEGGMGRVYKGHDRDLDRCVAIKILRDEDDASTARLLREARAQARIEHENICRVYESESRAGVRTSRCSISRAALSLKRAPN